MKDDFSKEELLSDVLGEAAPPSFRESSLDQMLSAVQQRRVSRKRVQALGTVACIVLIVGFGWMFFPKQTVTLVQRAGPTLVHSGPLNPEIVIATQPGLITLVTSPGLSVALVEEIPVGDLFELIGDDKLLGLFASRPAALIHRGTSSELVFLDSADSNGFQVH